MSDIVSRWPVRLALAIGDSDRDAGRRLTEAAVDRLVAEAADAYFDLCRTVDSDRVEIAKQVNVAGVPVEGDHITISVGVVEIYPDEFTLEARLRPAAGEGIAGQAKRRYKVGGGVDEEMRDEFIALAHAARYTH